MSEDLSEFVAKSAGEKTVRCESFDYTPGTGWSQDSGANLYQRGLLVTLPAANGFVHSWVPVNYTYDNGGSMTIGGDTCHLCGANIVSRRTYEWQGKRRWKTSREVLYECGTNLFTQANGKKIVYVGSKCIKLKGVV